MYNGPMFFKGSMGVMLFIVLVSFLFVWLFNAYRLRKLKKSKQDARSRKRGDRIDMFIVFLFIIVTALAAYALESFL